MCISVCKRLAWLLLVGVCLIPGARAWADASYFVGFSKVDLTPREPVRLTGFFTDQPAAPDKARIHEQFERLLALAA